MDKIELTNISKDGKLEFNNGVIDINSSNTDIHTKITKILGAENNSGDYLDFVWHTMSNHFSIAGVMFTMCVCYKSNTLYSLAISLSEDELLDFSLMNHKFSGMKKSIILKLLSCLKSVDKDSVQSYKEKCYSYSFNWGKLSIEIVGLNFYKVIFRYIFLPFNSCCFCFSLISAIKGAN
jgi:hypothetical protein